MVNVCCWKDLERYGIEPLTGEACGLMWRILFDLTAKGRKIIETSLGIKITSEAWNRGTVEEPHVASVMLSQDMLVTVAIFALLESGHNEVWLLDNKTLYGFEPGDRREVYISNNKVLRKFTYAGTAGSRNVHQMSGRVE